MHDVGMEQQGVYDVDDLPIGYDVFFNAKPRGPGSGLLHVSCVGPASWTVVDGVGPSPSPAVVSGSAGLVTLWLE